MNAMPEQGIRQKLRHFNRRWSRRLRKSKRRFQISRIDMNKCLPFMITCVLMYLIKKIAMRILRQAFS